MPPKFTSRLAVLARFGVFFLVLGAASCAPPAEQTPKTQLETRSIQSHTYPSVSQISLMRAAIETLQDFQFILEKSDKDLGIITATKASGGTITRITLTIRPWGKEEMLVRMNTTQNDRPLSDPKIYRDFFSGLSKSLMIASS